MKTTVILCLLLLMPMMGQAETFDITFGTIGTGNFVYDTAVKGFDSFSLDFASLGMPYANLGLNSGMLRPHDGGYGNLEENFGPWGEVAPTLYSILTNPQAAGSAYMSFAPGLMFIINGNGSQDWTAVNNEDLCATPGAPAGGYAFCTPTASGLGMITAGQWSSPAAVPEPATWLLMGTGIFLLVLRRKIL